MRDRDFEIAADDVDTPADDEGVPKPTMIRDFIGFEIKLLVDGLKDLILAQIAIVAILLELLFVRRNRGRIFYGVMGAGSRFEEWLRLFEPVSGDEEATERVDANRILRDAERRIFSREDEPES